MDAGASAEGDADSEGDEICSHCLRLVPPDLGVENSMGHVLCSACYSVLWRPKAKSSRLGLLARTAKPGSPRKSGNSIWSISKR